MLLLEVETTERMLKEWSYYGAGVPRKVDGRFGLFGDLMLEGRVLVDRRFQKH